MKLVLTLMAFKCQHFNTFKNISYVSCTYLTNGVILVHINFK